MKLDQKRIPSEQYLSHIIFEVPQWSCEPRQGSCRVQHSCVCHSRCALIRTSSDLTTDDDQSQARSIPGMGLTSTYGHSSWGNYDSDPGLAPPIDFRRWVPFMWSPKEGGRIRVIDFTGRTLGVRMVRALSSALCNTVWSVAHQRPECSKRLSEK